MNILFFLFAFYSITTSTFSLQKGEVYPIAFYNVENLFDTKRNYLIEDEDFTPSGKYNWTKEKYQKKLNNLAYVISKLGKEQSSSGFAILGVAEVENKKVIQDLIQTGDLAKKNYKIVHSDSPDVRGIDVGLIYNPNIFTVKSYKTYPLKIPGNNIIKTRDILVVNGLLAGEPLSIMVNHWPSRRGGNTEYLRELSAGICKHIADSIYSKDPKAGIIIMGDMNDNPNDKSTCIVIGAKRNIQDVKRAGFYNTMWQLYDKGVGSAKYNNKWDLFDQIIISESILRKGKSRFCYEGSQIFNKSFLIQQSGKHKDYPLRTFSGKIFENGYSDHFPTLIFLSKK